MKTLYTAADELSRSIESRAAKVGVIGLGYVGLPLAVRLAAAGFGVSGFDVSDERLKAIKGGVSYLTDVDGDELEAVTTTGQLRAFSTFAGLSDLQLIIICVPTPITKNKTPDLSFIASATREVAARLRPGQLIVLESTTYPGTTEDTMLPILEANGIKVGRDFYLAFSPERVDPGNGAFGIFNTPKIVGGVTRTCARLAAKLYRTVVDQVVVVSSPKVAETAKLFENVFRNVNIALVNELLVLCDKMGISVWEVIEAAATKPFGFMRFDPGPGVGGHCIPVDPYYLAAKAKEYDIHSHFIELAGEVNANMPTYVVQRIGRILNERERALRGSRILVLGASYKPNVADTRGSPALEIIRQLRAHGALASYNDPLVTFLDHEGLASQPLTEALLHDQDLVVLVCHHGGYDLPWIAGNSRLLLDTRNAVSTDGLGKGVIKL